MGRGGRKRGRVWLTEEDIIKKRIGRGYFSFLLTYGHRIAMTDPAQRAESVKIPTILDIVPDKYPDFLLLTLPTNF